MKNNIDNFIRASFEPLKSLESFDKCSTPSKEQKEAILNKVLIQANAPHIPNMSRFKNMVFVYPWRFAFGASVLQATIFTSIFGSKYSNLFFQFLGR